MKLYNMKSLKIVCLVGACMLGTSCVELDQYPTGEVASDLFWKTEADAEYALNAVYMQARRQFNRNISFLRYSISEKSVWVNREHHT